MISGFGIHMASMKVEPEENLDKNFGSIDGIYGLRSYENTQFNATANTQNICRDFYRCEHLLQGCIDTENISEGKRLHTHMIESGFKPPIFQGNRLIDVYAKRGRIEDARQVFDKMVDRDDFTWNTMIAGYAKWGMLDDACNLFHKMPERNSISWSSLITGYARHGYGKEALELFRQMKQESMIPSSYTFGSVLKACTSFFALAEGEQTHGHIIKTKFDSFSFVASALVDMYAKCKRVENARKVLTEWANGMQSCGLP